MYFWNLQALRESLRDAPPGPREQALYLGGLFVFWGVPFSVELPPSAASFPTALVVGAGLLLSLGVALAGLRYAYVRNGGPSGRDFLARIVPVAFVVGVRFALLIALLYVSFWQIGIPVFAGLLADPPQLHALAAARLAVQIAVQLAYWWVVGDQLARIDAPADG